MDRPAYMIENWIVWNSLSKGFEYLNRWKLFLKYTPVSKYNFRIFKLWDNFLKIYSVQYIFLFFTVFSKNLRGQTNISPPKNKSKKLSWSNKYSVGKKLITLFDFIMKWNVEVSFFNRPEKKVISVIKETRGLI